MAVRGGVCDGPISRFVHNVIVYMCTKFGAFITKCTIVQPLLLLLAMPGCLGVYIAYSLSEHLRVCVDGFHCKQIFVH